MPSAVLQRRAPGETEAPGLQPAAAREPIDPPAADWRLKRLVGDAAWDRLPAIVQRRFSKPCDGGAVRLYRGRVTATSLSLAGRVLASLARLVGAPLPLDNGAEGPSSVTVIEDARLGGQVWTRLYPRMGHFPQVVHSAKRFRGPTGLEEFIGSGIGMELVVTVEGGQLIFRSNRYFIETGGIRLVLPGWLSPGAMEIVHRQETADEFSFTLTLIHPVLGLLMRQDARYCDA